MKLKNTVLATMLMAEMVVGVAAFGHSQDEATGPSLFTRSHHAIRAVYVPEDSWSQVVAAAGVTGTFVTASNRRWRSISFVRETLTAIGIPSTYQGDRLALSVSGTFPVNLKHPLAFSPDALVTIAINGHDVAALPALKKPGSPSPYLPVAQRLTTLNHKVG